MLLSMNDPKANTSPLSDDVLAKIFMVSDSSTLKEALERLILTAKTSEGRSDLASKQIILPVLELCQFCLCSSTEELSLVIKLLRNLCAGEIINQNLFIEHGGVSILSTVISSFGLNLAFEAGILRVVLQVLGNVSLAGEKHCEFIWKQFFPHGFCNIAKFRSCKTCDPLSMIIYLCLECSDERVSELISDQGDQLLIDIVQTVTIAGYEESWVKLLLYRICIGSNHFNSIFNSMSEMKIPDLCQTIHFSAHHGVLLRVLAEGFNDYIREFVVSNEFSLMLFNILRKAVEIIDFSIGPKSSLPTGSADIDTLGYSLSILRDISAFDCSTTSSPEKQDPISTLFCAGIIKFLIELLRDLEPPSIIRNATIRNSVINGAARSSLKQCPYKGFRSNIVAVLGNCSYRRKNVQNEIREQDGIFLLLQQCVTDEDNPYLREWGIWSLRNILEGNTKNQQLVAELELQQPVDTPEISELGIRVDVDPKSGRPKLVNLTP